MALKNVAWGLDVGTTALKAIKLRKEGGEVAVEAFDVVEHEKFLSEPDADRNAIIKHTLAKFLERNGIKKETVFVGVPGSSTFARFVKLPPVEPKRIPEIVKFEAMQQIPFPLEQVNWDFQTFINPDSPEVEVGIFAMKKELVAQVMMNFREVNLDVQGVQMSPLAVYNAVQYDGTTGGKGAVVLDIGAEHTDLVFLDGGRVWLRTINIGGNHFTDSLAKSFKVSFKKAEDLKRTAATSKYAKQIFQAMRPVFADLAAEIQRSKGFYDSSHRDSKIEKIIGMGNTFKLPNLQKYIQQEMKLEVIRLDGFNRANVDPKLAAGLTENVLSMASAYGLALQGLEIAAIDTNLLPIEVAKANLWRAKRPWFAGAAAAVVVGVAIQNYQSWSTNRVYGKTDSSDVEAVDPDRAAQMKANDLAIIDQGKTDKQFAAIGSKAQFDNYMQQVESYKRLATDRKMWPMILGDIFTNLPQAKTPVDSKSPRVNQRIMIITLIKSDYLSSDDWKSWPVAPSVAPGVPVAAAATPTPAAGTAAADATAVVTPPQQLDHGFGITIIGYTPLPNMRNASSGLLRDYTDRLYDATDPKKLTVPKPYRFDFPSTSHYEPGTIKLTTAAMGGGMMGGGGTATPAAGALTFALPWGVNNTGPYWDAMVPEMLGVKRVDATATGVMGAGTTTDMSRTPGVDPEVLGDLSHGTPPGTLSNYTSFIIRLKVNLATDK